MWTKLILWALQRPAQHQRNFRRGIAIICLCISPYALSEPLTFALFGDVYTTPIQAGYLKDMLTNMANSNMAFAIGTGGSKLPEQPCDDKNLLAAYPVLLTTPLPVFYIPGDAEWRFCEKKSHGGFKPEERLELLRKVFYTTDRSFGQPGLTLTRQINYPEHMRWQSGSAFFITASAPNNEPSPAEQNRSEATFNWIKTGFDLARTQASTIVIIMSKEIAFEASQAKTPAESDLLALLQVETLNFPGQVLLVHGGNGVHRIDHPIIDSRTLAPAQNFTRVETYGALQQGWVSVRINQPTSVSSENSKRSELVFESHPWPPLNISDEGTVSSE